MKCFLLCLHYFFSYGLSKAKCYLILSDPVRICDDVISDLFLLTLSILLFYIVPLLNRGFMEKVQYSRAASGVADDNTQGGAAPRRKMAEADGSLVTATMLETTNINIQNPEHSRVSYLFHYHP